MDQLTLSFTSSGNRSFTPKETIQSQAMRMCNIIDVKMSINKKLRVFRHSYG